MAAFNEDFSSGDDFEAVLAISCCYDYGKNTSKTVEKIATEVPCPLKFPALPRHIVTLTVKKVGY